MFNDEYEPNRVESVVALAFDKSEPRAVHAGFDLAIETRAPSGVAGAAVATDIYARYEGVLIAIHPEFDQRLRLARRIALAPKLSARARPVMDDAGVEGLLQRVRVHVGDHQHGAVAGVDGHAGQQTVRAEFRLERQTLFPISHARQGVTAPSARG